MTTHDWRALVRDRIAALDIAREPEILDELAQHLSDLHAEGVAAGLTDAAALDRALAALPREREATARHLVDAARSLPGVIADRWTVAEPPLRARGAGLLSDFRRDLVHAIRSLRASPGYTLVVLLTMALGIGANSAIFAAVDTILLRPLPYAHADRLVVPLSVNVARDIEGSITYADYLDWRRETDVFEALAIWRPVTTDLTGAGQPERIRAVQVTPEFFTVFTVTPIVGRTLIAADHEANAPRVVMLTHGLWQRTFGGDPGVIGRTIRVGGTPRQIVGVLPPRVAWPAEAELFTTLPAQTDADVRTRRDNMIFSGVARLKDGVPLSRGNEVLKTIAAGLERDFPASRQGWTNRLETMRDYMVAGAVRRTLWVLLAAVGAVLLIGCANIAHLALVRGLRRSRELSVRVALGASRWRLVRQLGTECLLLAGGGAVGGALLAVWMIRGLAAIAPAGTPFVDGLGLDLRVLGATGSLAVVVLLLAGLLPALVTSRVQAGPALKDGSAGAGSSRRVALLRHGLIVAEVAGASVLLIGSALLIRSFWTLQHVNPGVDVDRVITARISLPRAERYDSSAKSQAFFERYVERLQALPNVEAAGATSFVPVGGGGFGLGRVFLAEGRPEPPAGPDVSAQWNVITRDYFRTVGIPILRGRAFSADDRTESTPVIVVSQSFASRMFGDDNPIGKRVRSWRDENLQREIVGVVGEVRYTGLNEREQLRQVYVPHSQQGWGLMNVAVRVSGGAPDGLAPRLRAELAAIDPDLAISNVATLRAIAGDSVANERYTTLLLSLLALTALGLGAIGIYGVVSHAVSLRRREFGVRAALGASRAQLSRTVLAQGFLLTSLGLAIGLSTAMMLSSLFASLLYETRASDPLAYGATIAVIGIAAMLACLLPALRAANTDPLIAIREQ